MRGRSRLFADVRKAGFGGGIHSPGVSGAVNGGSQCQMSKTDSEMPD